MKGRTGTKLVAALAGLMLASAANAASISVDLDQSNKKNAFPSGSDYLRVTISDGDNGDIDFLVETLDPLQDSAAKRGAFGIKSFSFNFGTSGARSGNIDLPTNWRLSNPAHGPFGIYDVSLSANKWNRRDPLSFSISGVDGDRPIDYLQSVSLGEAPLGNFLFGADVGGLNIGNNKGKWKEHQGKHMAKVFDRLLDEHEEEGNWKGKKGRGPKPFKKLENIPFDRESPYARKFHRELGCNSEESDNCSKHYEHMFGKRGGGNARFAGGNVVPIPAAAWLFGSGLLGLIGFRHKQNKEVLG